ncbi:MAG TPA: BatD family protein [Candidatus Saccharimonadales bacterium]|nr:BatD family protein [Candidatus Saccharimonadales bacterium]
MQKNVVKQVEVGVPFYLYITAENFENAQEPKGISGIEYFPVSPSGTQQEFSFINGAQSKKITFMYVVTPEKKGSFSLGPVEIQDSNGDSVSSEKIKVEVGDTPITTTKQQKQPYVLHAAIDNKSVYIGQKVRLLIRFCYQDQFDQLILSDAQLENFHRGFVSPHADKGSMKIGDDEYEYEQWLMELYPEKTGTLTIPMFQAAFIPALKYQTGFGGIFGFSMQSTLRSNPKSIEVKPLPHSKEFKHVTAIGTFDSMTFQLQQTKGAIGEGIVATMIIQGDGNLEMVKAPELKLPDGLHSYQGNSSIERLQNGQSSKKFEWIIQGDNSGTFTIAPQKFLYFDLDSQAYKTITSEKVVLTIIAAPVLQTDKKEPTNTVKKSDSNSSYVFKDHEINFVNQTDLKQNFSTSPLSNSIKLQSLIYTLLTWFLILMAILAVLIGVFWFSGSYVRDSWWVQSLYFKYLFRKYYHRQDAQAIYHLFVSLGKLYEFDLQGMELAQCFEKLKLESHSSSPDVIRGSSNENASEAFQQWQQFVVTMLQINFAGNQGSSQERNEFFSQAQKWLSVILSCCKLRKKSYADKSVKS